jgi:PAS domain S-box-containing protein
LWIVIVLVGALLLGAGAALGVVWRHQSVLFYKEKFEAAQALRASEEKCRTLFQTMAQGVVYQSADGKIISANPAAERILGLTLDEMQGRTSIDPRWRATHEDGSDFPGQTHPGMVALQTGREVRDVVMGVYNPRTKSHAWININAVPKIEPGDDKPCQVYATFDDITDRKRAEEALKHSAEQWQATFDGVDAAVCLLSAQAEVVQCNAAMTKLGGRPADQCVGRTCCEIIHGSKKPLDGCPFMKARRSLRRESKVFLIGSRWFEVTADPLTAQDGSFAGAVHIVSNITDRKRAEEENQRLADMVDRALASITIHDFEGRFLYANQRTLDLHGYNSKKEFLAVNLHQLDTPENEAMIAARMQKLREEGKAVFEVAHRRKDGTVLPLEVNASIVQWGDRQVILSMAIDVTERKKAENQVAAYQRRLRAMGTRLALAEENERRRIAADLHDDVAQSLALVKIKLQSLRAAHPDTAPATMEEIESMVGHAAFSTRSLLFDLSPPPLYELGLEAAVEWLAEKIQAGHKLPVAVEDDRQAKPLSEETRGILFRAVRELLYNTVKHANARQVRVAISRENPHIRVEVADDGTGFTPDKSHPHHDASGGFGLFHIRELLDYVGGSMKIHSEPGCGTRVILLAPLNKDPSRT